MSVKIKIDLNDGLYLKDPQDSKLGKKIIQFSIEMIYEMGFESFNFKKLATKINSTEASIYRYFENKHLLLLYLVNWYWEWVNFLINSNTKNIKNPKKKLEIVIHSLVFATADNPLVEFIDESKLHKIVVFEGTKAYHTFNVNKENSLGLFRSYKELTANIASIILENNATFKYPKTLASNLFEMANNQLYFSKYLPKLTDITIKNSHEKEVEKLLTYFLEKLLP